MKVTLKFLVGVNVLSPTLGGLGTVSGERSTMTEPSEDTHKLHVYLDVMGGCYRWILRSASGEPVKRSSKRYLQKALCLCEVESIRQLYPRVIVRELTIKSTTGRNPETG